MFPIFSISPPVQYDFSFLLWYNRLSQFPCPPVGEINEILCSFDNGRSGNLKFQFFEQKNFFLLTLSRAALTESLSFDFRVVEAAD